jgi:hypothetical protein
MVDRKRTVLGLALVISMMPPRVAKVHWSGVAASPDWTDRTARPT